MLKLPMLQPDQVTDPLHAYQLAKRANSLRVMAPDAAIVYPSYSMGTECTAVPKPDAIPCERLAFAIRVRRIGFAVGRMVEPQEPLAACDAWTCRNPASGD